MEKAEADVAAHSTSHGSAPHQSSQQLLMFCEDDRRTHIAEFARYNKILQFILPIHNEVEHNLSDT